MEIERKFLLKELPPHLSRYPHTHLVQGYLSVSPVVRVRREGDSFFLTYKGDGLMMREEYNHPLSREAFEHLLEKTDGTVITKERYRIPFGAYTIELDIFSGLYEGLILAEVEFPTEEEANAFIPPSWFGTEVTLDGRYHNSYLSSHTYEEIQ